MILKLNVDEVETIEEILSMKMVETQDKTLLAIIKKIRNQMDEQ